MIHQEASCPNCNRIRGSQDDSFRNSKSFHGRNNFSNGRAEAEKESLRAFNRGSLNSSKNLKKSQNFEKGWTEFNHFDTKESAKNRIMKGKSKVFNYDEKRS